MFKTSEADIFSGIFCCSCGKGSGTDNRERLVFPYAVRRASQRKEPRAFAVKGGGLGKGNEPRTPRGTSREARSRITDNISERVDTTIVSGVVLAKTSEDATRSEGQTFINSGARKWGAAARRLIYEGDATGTRGKQGGFTIHPRKMRQGAESQNLQRE